MATATEVASSKTLGFTAVIAALRKHSNKRMSNSEDDVYMAAFAFRKETDRGAIILATTAFEDALQRALMAMFQPLNSTEAGELFGFDAPLRSFSAKIRLAYALGVLDKPRKRIAETIRVMRNTCAHSGQATSFDDKSLMNALYFMLQEIGYDGDALGLKLWSDEKPDYPRFLFLTLVSELIVGVTTQAGLPENDYTNLFRAYLGLGILEEEGQLSDLRIRPTRWDPDEQTGR